MFSTGWFNVCNRLATNFSPLRQISTTVASLAWETTPWSFTARFGGGKKAIGRLPIQRRSELIPKPLTVPVEGDEGLDQLYESQMKKVQLDWWYETNRYHFWPKWNMRRDKIRRDWVRKEAEQRLRFRCLRYNEILPEAFREKVQEDINNNLAKYSRLCFLKNVCQITGRPRGNVVRCRLSRHIFRDRADHAKLSGVIRACW